VDPWRWERNLIDSFQAETYGECTCDHWWVWFGSLFGLVVVAESLTVFFAWRTLNAPEYVRETGTIWYTILLHLQSWFIGIPILSVLDSDSNAT
jgi:hypothetical protein